MEVLRAMEMEVLSFMEDNPTVTEWETAVLCERMKLVSREERLRVVNALTGLAAKGLVRCRKSGWRRYWKPVQSG